MLRGLHSTAGAVMNDESGPGMIGYTVVVATRVSGWAVSRELA